MEDNLYMGFMFGVGIREPSSWLTTGRLNETELDYIFIDGKRNYLIVGYSLHEMKVQSMVVDIRGLNEKTTIEQFNKIFRFCEDNGIYPKIQIHFFISTNEPTFFHRK